MIKISAIIIAKNEENMIADCIESVGFCDEILVIDNESSDKTAEVAKRMGAKIYVLQNRSFSDLRNFGFTKAKNSWILYLDADERISSALRENIEKTIGSSSNKFSAFKIQRKNFYLGRHEWPKIELLERLFKKSNLKEWLGELHETPKVQGSIGIIKDGFLLHYTHRDLTSMLRKTIEWSDIEAKLRFDAHHPKVTWWRFPRVMITTFNDYYIKQKGYKVGTVGLIESIYQAFSIFVTYAKLWELQLKQNKI